jgi:hypothetical protein
MPYSQAQLRAMMAKGGKSKQAARDYLRNEAPGRKSKTKKKKSERKRPDTKSRSRRRTR